MCGKNRRKIADSLKLYLILETDMIKYPLQEFISMVAEGGVTAIQLRNKFKTAMENYEIGLKISDYLKDKNVLFVINDRIDLAAVLSCNNVHLGTKDLPLKQAKKIYPHLTIGYSCNNRKDIQTAAKYKADYIGVGPAFYTDTKKDLKTVLKPEGIKQLVKETSIPAVAIGGINLENVNMLKNTGIKGIAVSSAICAAENPYKTTLRLKNEINNWL